MPWFLQCYHYLVIVGLVILGQQAAAIPEASRKKERIISIVLATLGMAIGFVLVPFFTSKEAYLEPPRSFGIFSGLFWMGFSNWFFRLRKFSEK